MTSTTNNATNSPIATQSPPAPVSMLTSSKGLDRQYTVIKISEYINENNKKTTEIKQNINGIITAAIMIASFILSFIAIIWVPPVGVPLLKGCIILNIATGGIIPAVTSMGITTCIINFTMHFFSVFSTLKTRHEEFKKNQEGLTPVEDIKFFLNRVDDDVKQDLINQMNFEQLATARRAVGDNAFRRFVANGKTMAHIAWQGIYDLAECKTSVAFATMVLSPAYAKLIKDEPAFSQALMEYLNSNPRFKEFADIFQRLLDTQVDPIQLDISDGVNDHTIKIVKKRYEECCEGALRTELDAALAGKSTSLVALDDEDDPTTGMVLYLKFIGGQLYEWDKKTLLKVMDFCEKHSQIQALKMLDEVLVTHTHLFTELELHELALKTAEFAKLQEYVANCIMQQEMTDDNWVTGVQLQAILKHEELRQKCRNYANYSLFESALLPNWKENFNLWLTNCFMFHTEQEFNQLLAQFKQNGSSISSRNWDILWDIAKVSGIIAYKNMITEIAFNAFSKNPEEWLGRCIMAGKRNELSTLLQNFPITMANVKSLYSAIEGALQTCAENKRPLLTEIKQKCLTFIAENSSQPESYGLWPMATIPNDVAAILYR